MFVGAVDQLGERGGRPFQFGGEAHHVDQRAAQIVADDIGEALDFVIRAGQIGGALGNLLLERIGEIAQDVARHCARSRV